MNNPFQKTELNNEAMGRTIFFSSSPRTELVVLILILGILLYFPVFSFLGTLPMRIWDESRYAINAVEMVKSGNLLVTTYNNEPDLWNTKPPLMIWLQAISIKIFGITEFAIRLPSALAAFFTCVFVSILSYRISGSNWLPFIITMVLITSPGYVSIHGIRTGDFDSLLTLILTVCAFSIYYFHITGNKKYYYAFFLFLSLAVLTKGIAGLLIAPGILIFLALNKQILKLLKMQETWFGVLFFVLFVSLYYIMAEFRKPGYFENVLYNEITGRYLSNVEGHARPFDFYFSNLIHQRYIAYLPFLISGILFNNFSRNKTLSQLSNFSSIIAISYILTISISTSKLEHYDLPLYPFMAVISGIFIFNIFNILYDFDERGKYFKLNILPLILLLFIFSAPYINIFNQWVNPKETDNNRYFYSLGYALKHIAKNSSEFSDIKISHEGYNAHIEYYRHMLKEKEISSEYANFSSLKPNDILVVGDENQLKNLSGDLQFSVIESIKHARIVKIIKVRKYDNISSDFEKSLIDNNCYVTCNPWSLEKIVNKNTGEDIISVFSNFESGLECPDFSHYISSERAYSGNNSIFIDQNLIYSASFSCKYESLKEYDFVEVRGYAWSESAINNVVCEVTCRDSDQTYSSQITSISNANFQPGVWTEFQVYYSLKKDMAPNHSNFIVYFISDKINRVYIDDVRITLFNSDYQELIVLD